MQAVWLPAHSESFNRQLSRLGLFLMLDKTSEVYYPHALVAYPHWTSSRPSMDARLRPKVSKTTGRRGPKTRYHQVPFDRSTAHVFGDSGGFTIRTLGMKFDPIDVLYWQGLFCSAGVFLDVPTWDSGNSRIWDRAVSETKALVQRALPTYLRMRKEGNPFRWWGVIHGMPGGEREYWRREMANVYPFTDEGEGWSILPQPTQVNRITPRAVASAMGFIRDQGIKRLHVLMCTRPECVATLLCLQEEAGVDFITYDSSTYAMSGTKRTMIMPTADGLSYDVQDEQFRATTAAAAAHREHSVITDDAAPPPVIDRVARDWLLQQCPCPACARWHQDIAKDEAYWMEDSRIGYRFSLHNFAIQKQTFERLTAAAYRDPEHTLRTLLGPEWGVVRRAFDGRESIVTQSGSYRSLLDY